MVDRNIFDGGPERGAAADAGLKLFCRIFKPAFVGFDAEQRHFQVRSLGEPLVAQIVDGFAVAATGVEDDNWSGLLTGVSAVPKVR